jgi:hypothetical protein
MALVLLVCVVHDPRAEIARLLGGNGLIDDSNLHECTPVWLNGR